jgi:hypothetical protein
MKAFAKQVQAEKEKQRTKAKKDHISDMTKLRKQRENSGFAGKLPLSSPPAVALPSMLVLFMLHCRSSTLLLQTNELKTVRETSS